MTLKSHVAVVDSLDLVLCEVLHSNASKHLIGSHVNKWLVAYQDGKGQQSDWTCDM